MHTFRALGLQFRTEFPCSIFLFSDSDGRVDPKTCSRILPKIKPQKPETRLNHKEYAHFAPGASNFAQNFPATFFVFRVLMAASSQKYCSRTLPKIEPQKPETRLNHREYAHFAPCAYFAQNFPATFFVFQVLMATSTQKPAAEFFQR